MKNIISLDDFKNNKSNNTEKTEDLTKAGKSFRERFLNALQELELVFDKEISKANFSSEIKTKINISSVLKHAKSSPLAAYSDLHKQFVEDNIKEAINRCNKKLDVKFQDKKKPTIESLQKRLVEERALHKAEISKLASQKMSEYLQLMDIKNGK